MPLDPKLVKQKIKEFSMMKRPLAKNIPFSELDNILRMRCDEGATMAAIARKYGASYNCVRTTIIEYAPQLVKRYNKLSDEVIQEIIRLRKEERLGYSNIGKKLGLNVHAVRDTLKQFARELMGRGIVNYPVMYDSDPERTAEIIRLRKKRWTYNSIGGKFGITRERVRQILNTRGASSLTGPLSRGNKRMCK